MNDYRHLDLWAFLARVLYPSFTVFATFNTSGYSFYHWVVEQPGDDLILKVFAGGLLALSYYNIGETMAVALQRTGLLIVVVTGSAGAWYLIDQRWIAVDSRTDLINAMQMTLVLVMAVGLSYAHLHSRIGGIKVVEEGRNV
ncbi:MAG: DUF6524 family protein [Alphaproteobacteria bacterium]|nr:DUF6524 family protein [Alphaproteobacteria bacterium]